MATPSQAQFDIQGHRGCRGLFPENSIEGFIEAIKLGVTTLEMDVVITGDQLVLVSHEPFMSHEICLLPNGMLIRKSEELKLNIFQMDIAAIQEHDCGSLGHSGFPQQVKKKSIKPLLSEVVDLVEQYISLNNLAPVDYNIETKSTPSGDNVFHPTPDIFADLLLKVIMDKGIENRTYIQSFDVRTLQHLRKINAPVKLVLLVENVKGPKHNIKRLGFNPDVYSPYFKLISTRSIKTLHKQGIRVIPWTVNDETDMIQLIRKGVDGIITDYPNKLVKLITPEKQ